MSHNRHIGKSNVQVFNEMMRTVQRAVVGEQPYTPEQAAIFEAAPWRRPSRAKDTTNQGDLDFSKRPEPEPAPEPKRKRPIDPSDVYTVLPRSEHYKFERPLEQYIIDDNWNSETINGQNAKSRIVGVLQNEIEGKVFYTVIYIMVHAEGLGKSTFKKRYTSGPIDQYWLLATAYFADSRGKIMSLLKRQSNNVKYGKLSRDAPRFPDKRPRIHIYDQYQMKNAVVPQLDPIAPDAPSFLAKKNENRLKNAQHDNARIAYSRSLDSYTSQRRYYRLDDLPSVGMVRAMGKDLWRKVAAEVGEPDFDEQDIPTNLLPATPEEWPSGTQIYDFDDYYDDEIDESHAHQQLQLIAEGVEHIFSRNTSAPRLDLHTNALIERFLTTELNAHGLDDNLAPRDLRTAKSLVSLAKQLEAELGRTAAYAGQAPYIISLSPARTDPNALMALIVSARPGEELSITARRFAVGGPSPADPPGEIGTLMAMPELPHVDAILRHWREMADTTLTTMDLRRALRRYAQGHECDLCEAIRMDTLGDVELDYAADRDRKRAQGDFKTAMRRTSKKDGRKMKGYQRKLKIDEYGASIQVIGAYTRTKDIPIELMQLIKAGAFNGSEQFTRRTALFMSAILRNRGIKPDYLLPLPSRAGFPARLANMLLDYLPGAQVLPSPPKIASISDVWIPKRRAKARDYYAAYNPPTKTSGTILIVDDWFVTGASIAAVAQRLVQASLDAEIGQIDELYGLVLGVSS